MLTRTAAALLLSTTMLTGAALAQTTAPASPTMPPSTAAPSAMPASGKFMTDQATTEFRASKFVGIDVYGTDNEKIGDISEVLIDGQGNAKAIVIGVGGFLGIGQKNVAVPWSSVTWSVERPPARAAAAPATGTATPGATTPMTGAPMTGGTPAATAPAAPARSPAEQAAYNGYPDHAKVTLTKAELQEAPAFKYYSETHASSGATSGTTPPATRP